MHLKHQNKLETAFDSLKQDLIHCKTNNPLDYPFSFWIQKKK